MSASAQQHRQVFIRLQMCEQSLIKQELVVNDKQQPNRVEETLVHSAK